MSVGASRKVSDERARQILAYALEQREHGRLFVHDLLASELEALAQEVLDRRTACGILNARIDELEELAGVSKSSPKNGRVGAAEFVHAPGASRK